MHHDAKRALRLARLVATLLYVEALAVYPLLGRVLGPLFSARPEVTRFVGPVLLGAGVAAYAFSLLLEHRMLARAALAAGSPARAFVAAIPVASCGNALGTFGLVLTLLGAPGFGAALYVLCAAHGLHLMLRWPNYEQAAHQMPE